MKLVKIAVAVLFATVLILGAVAAILASTGASHGQGGHAQTVTR